MLFVVDGDILPHVKHKSKTFFLFYAFFILTWLLFCCIIFLTCIFFAFFLDMTLLFFRRCTYIFIIPLLSIIYKMTKKVLDVFLESFHVRIIPKSMRIVGNMPYKEKMIPDSGDVESAFLGIF